MSYHNFKVLVLGVDDRSALTVVRSLGRKGVRVHIASDVADSICAYSKYCERVFRVNDAGKYSEQYIQELLYILKKVSYDLVIPTADSYLVLCVKHRKELEKYARFAIPDNVGFNYTYRKDKTLELATALGIPTPKSVLVKKKNEIKTIIKSFTLPVILKPVSSKVWKNGEKYSLRVQSVKSHSELTVKLERLLQICPVLIQSYHFGIGFGQEFLMNKGEMLAVFQHERIHEPRKGGGSSYRKSVPVDNDLLNHSLALLKYLEWTGVAMVEYKYNKSTSDFVLMEINGRFWGSLPLALSAGIDFPALLFDMLIFKKKPERSDYKINLYCRNITRDLDWFKENFFADKNDPYALSIPIVQLLREIKNIVTFRERYDTLVVDDLRPGIKQISDYLFENFKGILFKLRNTLTRINLKYNIFRRWITRLRIIDLIKKEPKINFICKGNIYRSPFAYNYIKNLLSKKTVEGLQISSYGLIDREKRRCPKTAIEAAGFFNVDLAGHRSRFLTIENINESSVMFVMDVNLFQRIKTHFPTSKNKIFLLSDIFKGIPQRLEISDPYGKNIDECKEVYGQLKEYLDILFKMISDQIIE